MPAVKLTPAQIAELRQIADGNRDSNRHLWAPAFRGGRDHARSRLADALDSADAAAFEQSAIEMDAEAYLFEGEFSFGFASVLDGVRGVLPSWPWLPGATGAQLATLNTEPEGN